jgi:hypothetical protein
MLEAYYKNKNICFYNTPSPLPIILHFYFSSEPNPESSEYETSAIGAIHLPFDSM